MSIFQTATLPFDAALHKKKLAGIKEIGKLMQYMEHEVQTFIKETEKLVQDTLPSEDEMMALSKSHNELEDLERGFGQQFAGLIKSHNDKLGELEALYSSGKISKAKYTEKVAKQTKYYVQETKRLTSKSNLRQEIIKNKHLMDLVKSRMERYNQVAAVISARRFITDAIEEVLGGMYMAEMEQVEADNGEHQTQVLAYMQDLSGQLHHELESAGSDPEHIMHVASELQRMFADFMHAYPKLAALKQDVTRALS